MAFFNIKLAVPIQSLVWLVLFPGVASPSLFLHHLKVLYATGDDGISTSPSQARNTALAEHILKCSVVVVLLGFFFFLETSFVEFFMCLQPVLFLLAAYNQLVTQVPQVTISVTSTEKLMLGMVSHPHFLGNNRVAHPRWPPTVLTGIWMYGSHLLKEIPSKYLSEITCHSILGEGDLCF